MTVPPHMQGDADAAARADAVFRDRRQAVASETDRLFAAVMVLQWLAGVAAAWWASPRVWTGTTSIPAAHHLSLAILLGGAIALPAVVLALCRPGRRTTRHVVAVAQMLASALLVQLTAGRFGTHLHVFGSLAFLGFYRDAAVFPSAVLVVAADYVLGGLYWPFVTRGVLPPGPVHAIEQLPWVIAEGAFLFVSCRRSVREMWAVACERARLEVTRARIAETVDRQTAELRASEERFRAMVEYSYDVTSLVDAQGDLLYSTPFERSGTAQERDVSSKQWWTCDVHSDDRALVELMLAEVLTAPGRPVSGELRLRVADGSYRWIAATARNFLDNPHLGAIVVNSRDVTERKEAEHTLARARDAALEATRLKSEFLANMSHEMRTPLNIIIGYAEMALGTTDAQEQREFLGYVRSSAVNLLALINHVLDLAKIEAGRTELHAAPIRLRELLGDWISTLEPLARRKNLQLECSVHPEVPDMLVADPGLLRQVLFNLIGNAIKFTDLGSVAVQVESTGDAADGLMGLHVTVSDTGIGIPLERQAAIFQAFVQGNGSSTSPYDGTGLGLTVALRLVELMGGRLWVESDVGRGSTFHFTVTVALRRRRAANATR